MHIIERRHRVASRNTLRNLRVAHWLKSIISKDNKAGFLLANAYTRCRTNSQNMQSMPNILSRAVKYIVGDPAYTSDMAAAKMGHGPGRPITPSQGGNRFAVVAVEYFTRWIEAKPLAKITSETVRKFFWQNIICRFGVLRILTVDNGK